MSNVYYDPEKFGLTPVAEVDIAGSYEFDMFVVWRRQDGKLAWATDSGCSCPIPFENVGIPDLAVGDRHAAIGALQAWATESYNNGDITPAIEALMKEPA